MYSGSCLYNLSASILQVSSTLLVWHYDMAKSWLPKIAFLILGNALKFGGEKWDKTCGCQINWNSQSLIEDMAIIDLLAGVLSLTIIRK